MLSKLTLLGLHKYSDGDIWSDLTFPEGINKETAIAEILRQCSEFCLLYPDMDYLKAAITAWGIKWYFTFEKWITVINTEYEPLWNLDVHIDISDDGNRSGDRSGATQGSTQGTITGSTQGSTQGTNEENTTGSTNAKTDIDATNTHQNAAYDSDEFKNAEKDLRDENTTSTGSSSQTVTGSSTGSSTVSSTETSTDTSSGSSSEEWTEADTNDHQEYRRGNQGITQSQQMLMSEINVRTWNIYSHIADIFANEFCITLYM